MNANRRQPRKPHGFALSASWLALWGALGAGCAEDGASADGVAVLTPDTVSFPWDDAFDLPDDGVAAFVPLDVMVYRSGDGLPVAHAVVVVRADGVELVSPAAVAVVGGEGEGCPIGGDGESCVWDVFGDALVRIDPSASPAPVFVGETDSAGLLRVYAVVDALTDDLRVSAHVVNRGALGGALGGLAEAELDASTGDASSWTQLLPR